MATFNDQYRPRFPEPASTRPGAGPYESYKAHTLKLQELRERRHEKLAEQLRKDQYRDHSGFIAQLHAERDKRYVMTEPEFLEWWSSLEPDRQQELVELFSQPVEATLRESRNAVMEAFDARQAEEAQ